MEAFILFSTLAVAGIIGNIALSIYNYKKKKNKSKR